MSKVADWEVSGMPQEGYSTPGVGHPLEASGRSLPPKAYLHQRTHPEPVEGCFGCRIASVGVALAPHASTLGNGIDTASELKLEHQARARREPDRYAPAGSRWV
jgi:hypothetical protein